MKLHTMDRYRIPTIDEFVPAFKYELNCDMVLTTQERIDEVSPWAICSVGINTDLHIIEISLKQDLIRVKI